MRAMMWYAVDRTLSTFSAALKQGTTFFIVLHTRRGTAVSITAYSFPGGAEFIELGPSLELRPPLFLGFYSLRPIVLLVWCGAQHLKRLFFLTKLDSSTIRISLVIQKTSW